jgi:hypothetical protein
MAFETKLYIVKSLESITYYFIFLGISVTQISLRHILALNGLKYVDF